MLNTFILKVTLSLIEAGGKISLVRNKQANEELSTQVSYLQNVSQTNS